MFISKNQTQPWLEIDFGYDNAVLVQEVIIVNNFNGYGFHLRDALVRVGNNPMNETVSSSSSNNDNTECATYKGPAKNGDVVILHCNNPLLGRYVSLQLMTTNDKKTWLAINEFKACGEWNNN